MGDDRTAIQTSCGECHGLCNRPVGSVMSRIPPMAKPTDNVTGYPMARQSFYGQCHGLLHMCINVTEAMP